MQAFLQAFLQDLAENQFFAEAIGMVVPRVHCHSYRTIAPQRGIAKCAHPMLRADRREISAGVCSICQLKKNAPPNRFFADPGQSDKIVERGQLQIVIARFKEDVEWAAEFATLDVIIYDKGDPDSPNALPNIGREAHTYLHHIIKNYDTLQDVTVFLQGNPFDHCGLQLPERIWQLHRGIEYLDLCRLALPEDQQGNPTQSGLPLAEYYEKIFDEAPPEFFLCRVGACFAVSRERIRSRPIEFYERLMTIAVDHELGPWLLERYWRKVFGGEDKSAGIVTAATASFYDDLQLMLKSLQIHSQYPITVFDLGLTTSQRYWIEDQPNVVVQQPAWECPYFARIRHLPNWPLWTKPFLMYASPYRRTVWIDADCTIVDSLENLFAELASHPIIIRDQTPAKTENTAAFYNWLPLAADSAKGPVDAPNSGVVGLDLDRDLELLAAWSWAAGMVSRNSKWAREVAWSDQGVLFWALRRLNRVSLIQKSTTWNRASFEVRGLIEEAVNQRCSMLDVIRTRFPATAIVHWLGCFKLSGQLRQEMDDLIFRGFDTPLVETCENDGRSHHRNRASFSESL